MRKKRKSIIEREINRKHFRVAVFGSARAKRNDETYKLVYRLAKLIGKENIDIVTGGGPGLMEAANRGHKAGSKGTGAHSFGLLIQLPKAQRTNFFLDVKKEFSYFSRRLDQFMVLSNAVVVAPGGIGTTLELFYTWQLIQVKQSCDIPIILLGRQWRCLINWVRRWLLRNKLIDKKDLNSIFLAKDYKEAMSIIKRAYEFYNKGDKNICLNIKKYKIYKQ